MGWPRPSREGGDRVPDDNGRIDFLVDKMVELSEKLSTATSKLDHILNSHYPMLMEKLDRVADKLDRAINKVDRMYDTLLKVVEYTAKHCNSNQQRPGLVEWAFRIIEILILALLTAVGIKLYTQP